jgi:purine-binding chemotaxis protein CheW
MLPDRGQGTHLCLGPAFGAEECPQRITEVRYLSLNERLDSNLLEEEYEEDEDTQEDKFLTFIVNGEEFGIEIRHVTEIIGIQNITEVPDMPHYIKGVINLRGKVIPVMDVRLRFGVKEREYDDRTCIIVINIDEQSVGMIVDRVSEVLDIPKNDVEPPPKVKRGESSRFIKGMGKVDERVKILLNEYQLLFDFNKGEDQ